MDSSPSLQQLSNFALKSVFRPKDLVVALFHQKIFDADLSKVFSTNQPLHIEYSYTDIFEKIVANSALSATQKKELLNLLKLNNVQPRLYFDDTKLLKDLSEESLFADMLVCNTGTTEKLGSGGSLSAIHNNLHCPVLVIPNDAQTIKDIFLVFDGQPSSMKAIKDFNYMLSYLLKKKNVTILSTMYSNGREQFEDKLLMQYAKLHIPNVAFMKVAGEDINSVLDFTRKNTDAMVVVGSNLSYNTKGGIRKDWAVQPLFFTKN
jgi:hypothetical protein